MSARLIALAYGVYGWSPDQKFGASKKAVLFRLCWKSEDDGSNITIPQAQIADDLGLSIDTVIRVTREFEDHGLLHLVADEDRARKIAKTYRLDVGMLIGLPVTATEAAYRTRIHGGGSPSTKDATPHGAGCDQSATGRTVRGQTPHGAGCDQTATGRMVRGQTPHGAESEPQGAGSNLKPNQRNQLTRAREGPDEGPSAPASNQPGNGADDEASDRAPAQNAHWKACLDEIAELVGASKFSRWVQPLIVLEDNGSRIHLAATDWKARQNVQKHLIATLAAATERRIEVSFVPKRELHNWKLYLELASGHWETCLPDVKQRIEASAFRSWIEPLVVVTDDATTLTLGAPSRLIEQFVAANYVDALEEATGRRIKLVVVG